MSHQPTVQKRSLLPARRPAPPRRGPSKTPSSPPNVPCRALSLGHAGRCAAPQRAGRHGAERVRRSAKAEEDRRRVGASERDRRDAAPGAHAQRLRVQPGCAATAAAPPAATASPSRLPSRSVHRDAAAPAMSDSRRRPRAPAPRPFARITRAQLLAHSTDMFMLGNGNVCEFESASMQRVLGYSMLGCAPRGATHAALPAACVTRACAHRPLQYHAVHPDDREAHGVGAGATRSRRLRRARPDARLCVAVQR